MKYIKKKLLRSGKELDLVNLKSSSKKDISSIDDKGVIISDQKNIWNHFNNYFVNIGHTIDKMIPNSKHSYREYLHQIKVSKSFFLTPTIPEEIFDIIVFLDLNKSLGPNSVPIYIIKIDGRFFSDKLSHYKFIICNWYFSRLM